MKPRSSYRAPKCYLSGMDWFMRALDCRTRAVTGIGNYSQIVLALRGRLDPRILRVRLHDFLSRNPVLQGHCRRNFLNLAPYWELPRAVDMRTQWLDARPAAPGSGAEPLSALANEVNQPLTGRQRIAFTLVPGARLSYLAMRFDHQVLDAAGAERLLLNISTWESTSAPLPLGDRRAHLNEWMAKFRSGQTVNRALLALRESEPPTAFPLPGGTDRIRSLFVFHAFSDRETKAIIEHAERRVGYLMLMPFLLGVTVRSFHELSLKVGLGGKHYVVPVTIDNRRNTAESVFFNRLSFNFYRFETGMASDQATLWKQAVTQLYDQTRARTAYHMAQAGYLMRICPAPWLGRLMGLPLSGSLGSFSFALVAGQGYDAHDFMDVPVANIYHTPRVPTPPGIGIYFNRYKDRLNMVLSYLDGMLDPLIAKNLVDTIAQRLRTGDETVS